ncbi:hypothetical protein QBC40DRAFT_578 [Triangularia verruculosa]|uniref:Polycomb protein VEFS-Box domain-containing protein n=1 Tax=Triangularia verruculosa TaxID=2587418 RepID=A0AAN7AZT4_9PEZI|nr:hypothetical protein QBC40DRAFT_578 [Triangularia verruculosa]
MTTIKPRARGLPYLHRNWKKALDDHIQMGNKASSESRDSVDRLTDQPDTTQRAVKRRRIQSDHDVFPLYEDYSNSKRGLRIEVLKVSHKDAPRVKNGIMNGLVPPNVKDVSQVKARCKLTITGYQGDHPVVLHVDSQVCDIKVFKNPAGQSPMARFYAIKPFHIPEEKILLERDDDAVFGLANTYSVLIELQSAGDPNWPPRDLVTVSDEDLLYSNNSGGLPPRQWMLSASIADIFNKNHRKTMRLRVKKHISHEIATNFIMDVDVRWLTAISTQKTMREQTKDILPCITAFDPDGHNKAVVNGVVNGVMGINGVNAINGANGRLTPAVNGELNGQVNGGSLPDTPDELMPDGDTTPNRSRRTKQNVNYNVRQMWNTAVGKETKKRRKFGEAVENGANQQVDEHIITYLLPPEQVQMEKLNCIICAAENDSLTHLRAHYQSHPQYVFSFEFRPKLGCCVTVKPNSENPGSPLRPKVYQLGLPVQPLDVEKYVNGDESWILERLGPDNDRDVVNNGKPARPQPKPAPKKPTKPVVLVPKTKQPLFDPYSKVPLEPGTPVPQYPIDDAWLLLKHREALQDFIDLNEEEKEYLQEWDAFILKKHISSQQYLPRAFLQFVREKALWLVEKQARAEEFSKHVSTLLARRVLGENEIIESTTLLNEARDKMAKGGNGAVNGDGGKGEKKVKKHRGQVCAGCEEPVPVSEMAICMNKQCKNRLWHVSCTEEKQEAKKRKWKCKDCRG